jgi:hypothetical protein
VPRRIFDKPRLYLNPTDKFSVKSYPAPKLTPKSTDSKCLYIFHSEPSVAVNHLLKTQFVVLSKTKIVRSIIFSHYRNIKVRKIKLIHKKTTFSNFAPWSRVIQVE